MTKLLIARELRFFPWLLDIAICVFAFQFGIANAQDTVMEFAPPTVNYQIPDQFRNLIDRSTRQILSTAQVSDDGDAWQLFRRLRPAIQDALGTQGYFSPTIRRIVDEQASEDQAPSVNITIDPGPQSNVVSVNIQFDGEINNDEFAARRERLKTLWLLGVNQPFNQSDWSASKDRLLRELLEKDFAAATLAESLANVDPEKIQLH